MLVLKVEAWALAYCAVVVGLFALPACGLAPDLCWIMGRYFRVHSKRASQQAASVSQSNGGGKSVMESKVTSDKVTYIGMNTPWSAMKHMNNVMYSFEFELARKRWLLEHPDIDSNLFQLVQVASSLRYRRELKPDQAFEVISQLAYCDLDKKCIVFDQRIVADDFVCCVDYCACTLTLLIRKASIEKLDDKMWQSLKKCADQVETKESIVKWFDSINV